MKACFASNGFNGKVDCHEFAKDTNYKSLPNKKETGGYNMLRPKNCMKCGGRKRQTGGLQPYTQSNTPAGSTTPTGQSSLAQNSQLTPAQIQALAGQFGFRTDSNQNLQQDLFNYAQNKQPQAYQQVMQKYGQTNAGSFVDNILGARTADLLQLLQKPQPQPQKAALTEHFFGPGQKAFGMASQKYRDSQSVTDPGLVNTADPQEWVDFQYYKPNSAEVDNSRGRYRIPNTVWGNQITRGTNTIQDPSLIDQYRYPAADASLMANNPIKMRGGRLMRMQTGGMPRREDFNDDQEWQYAVAQWAGQQQGQNQIGRASDIKSLLGNFNQPLQESDIVPGVNAPYPEVAQQQQQPMDRIQEGINKGIIEGPKDFPNAQAWYDFQKKASTSQPKQKSNPYQTLQNIGIDMRAFRTGLGEIAGRVERGRQNKYDYQQQTALGQMNPMPITDFQPNPYNLYMQQGGNLKTIMNDYNYWSNNAGPMDMTDGTGNPELKKGGYEIDRMIIVRSLLPKLLHLGRMGNKNNYEGGGEVNYGYMAKGGKWIPKDLKKGRCTPAPNPDCPVGSPQYNLAMTFKKHHGFHKK